LSSPTQDTDGNICLLDSGDVRCFVDAVVPFVRAAEAYSRRIEGRLGCGKVVISVKTG
jgi:NADPH:quinone reductase-like Zn-dependent oxidoreductase